EDDTLLVPVHAYPIANIVNFPSSLAIKDIPLGQSKEITIPLRCSCPVDFEFQLNFLQPHHAFTIQPTAGIIPANGQIDVVVTYTPFDRTTAQIRVQLLISQFNSKPCICTITGTSPPGLHFRSQGEDGKTGDTFTKNLLDPQSLSPMQISRKMRRQKILLEQSPGILKKVKMPNNLFNPHAVAVVLNEQPGKLRIKDLREVLTNVQGASKSKQAKEAVFNQKVNKTVMLERVNQLRWQTHLGRDPISAEATQLVLEKRQIADEEYKFPSCTPGFDPYSIDPWEVRHRALKRLQQAARKVIIQCRVNHRLILLQKLVKNVKREREDILTLKASSLFSNDVTFQEYEEKSLVNFACGDIQPFTFPFYVSPDWKDALAPDTLGPVSVKPSEVVIDKIIPFFNLKVFQRYKQMDYKPYSSQYVSSSYLPLTLSRPLRSGAENAAPDLNAHKRPFSYAETDLDYHLCPLPRYHTASKDEADDGSTQKKFIDRDEMIKGLMSWKRFPPAALTSLSNTDFLTNIWTPRWYDPFTSDMLPVDAPLHVDRLSDEDRENITMESSGEVVLTPEMLEAEFIMVQSSSIVPVPEEPKHETAKEDGERSKAKHLQKSAVEPIPREKREEQLNFWLESSNNQLGSNTRLRVEHLKGICTNKQLLLH
ncbi:hypothetical protein scyTo_0010421, partial [Scyliorhinus torazame]|nr:hypothetical protein [Scyliorhinus torazame]